MDVLFIGGTGNISASVSRLCLDRSFALTLVNRGVTPHALQGAEFLHADIGDPKAMASVLGKRRWDVVVDWLAYEVSDIERDIALFRGRIGQFVFISSASVYQKPPSHPVITESTPLGNPFWEYSRKKIAIEERLLQVYRDDGFPVTIVRPSHTYDTVIPVAIGGWKEFTIVDRIRKKKKIIVHGDGTSLWTLTHAEDFARGFVGLLGHRQALGHAFHITSDEILTWDQIYTTVAEAAGEAPRIVHMTSDYLAQHDGSLVGSLLGDKAHCGIFDNTKIKRFVPGYEATIPFSAGIRRTLGWFEAVPSRCEVRDETNRMMDELIAGYERAGGSAR